MVVDNEKLYIKIQLDEINIKIYKYDLATGIITTTYKDFIGYYADINKDGEIDGIIFADLLVGNTKGEEWRNSNGKYNIPTISINNLKKYYISQKDYEGAFGKGDVLSPNGSGKERFYIMSLSDINTTEYDSFYWYKNASGKIKDISSSNDFGMGKTNTITIIDRWNKGNVENEGFGEQDNQDMCMYIQNEVKNGWFVPSNGEWSAFGNELEITNNNSKLIHNLSKTYWTSSMCGTTLVWTARTERGYRCVDSQYPSKLFSIRLATTF